LPGLVNRTPLAERIALHDDGGMLTGHPVSGFDQRVFGGHLLAQVVLAAGAHAPAGRVLESLHAYFLRPGRPRGPIGWYLYVQDCPFAGERGGLARGTLSDRDGRVVASVAQHAVLLD
jgi:acyl-CoA thioesterase